jgi:hypothetical protein
LQPIDPLVNNARQFQRDDVPNVQATFRLTEEQAELWSDFYEIDLQQGGAWFAANWPLPQGRGLANWRMIGGPSWSLLDGAGQWAVTVQFEVQQRADLPVLAGGFLLLEDSGYLLLEDGGRIILEVA